MSRDGQAARRRHYGQFYGLVPLPTDRPLGLVHGNCQAESLRLFLDGTDAAFVSVPPVHELTDGDLPWLRRLCRRVQIVVSQPIRDHYRGLPLGTREVLAEAGARSAIVPVIRFAGLYPGQALIRPPADPSLVPPLVPYHDLFLLARAAGLRGETGRVPARAGLTAATVRAVAAESIRALGERERRHGAVAVSDLFLRPRFALMRTINHPGNPVWRILADRVRRRLGLGPGSDGPGREVLDAIHAPRDPAVIQAFGLSEAPRPQWTVGGEAVDPAQVAAAHLDFYAERPDVVAAGVTRHRATLSLLGFA